VSIKAHVGWAMLNKHLIMYLHIRDIWSPTNLVGSMVAELDDTPPNITGVQWDSVGATHRFPSQYHMEDLQYGKVGVA
jgi:hypothetical protein